jgi:hypothetical protein
MIAELVSIVFSYAKKIRLFIKETEFKEFTRFLQFRLLMQKKLLL